MAASALAVVSHVPQIWRLATDADDVGALSPGMFALQLVSGLLWFGYGLAGAHASMRVPMSAVAPLTAVPSKGERVHYSTPSEAIAHSHAVTGGGSRRAVARIARAVSLLPRRHLSRRRGRAPLPRTTRPHTPRER